MTLQQLYDATNEEERNAEIAGTFCGFLWSLSEYGLSEQYTSGNRDWRYFQMYFYKEVRDAS